MTIFASKIHIFHHFWCQTPHQPGPPWKKTTQADTLRVKQQCQVLGGVTSVALTQEWSRAMFFFWNWSSGLWFFTKKNWDCTNQNGDFLGCSNLAEIRELAMDVSRLWGNHFFWFINGWFSIAMLDGFSFLEWTLMWFNWFNDYHELQWVWPFENQTWLQNPATKWRFNGKII
jgi:hypothetical protein